MKTMMFICCTVLHIFSNWYWRILSQWKINFRHIETHFSLVLSSSLSLFINHSLMYKIDRITQRRIICVKNLFFQKCDATRKCFNQIPFKRHVHHVCSPFRTKYLENDTNSQIDFITYGRSARISMRKWKNMRPKIFHVIHKNRKALYNTSHSIGHTLFSSITKKKTNKNKTIPKYAQHVVLQHRRYFHRHLHRYTRANRLQFQFFFRLSSSVGTIRKENVSHASADLTNWTATVANIIEYIEQFHLFSICFCFLYACSIFQSSLALINYVAFTHLIYLYWYSLVLCRYFFCFLSCNHFI